MSGKTDGDDRPATSRGPFVASALLLAVVVVMGGYLVVDRWGRTAPTAAPQSGAQSAAATAPPVPAASGSASEPAAACGGGAVDVGPLDAPPLASAAGALNGSVVVASVDGHGPSRSAGGLPVCYAHTSTGALLAAANWVILSAGSDSPRAVNAALALNTETRARREAASDPQEGRRYPHGQVEVVAFQVEARDSDNVFVTLAVEAPFLPGAEGKTLVWPMRMVWDGGDWKYDMPERDGVSELTGDARSMMVEWGFPDAS